MPSVHAASASGTEEAGYPLDQQFRRLGRMLTGFSVQTWLQRFRHLCAIHRRVLGATHRNELASYLVQTGEYGICKGLNGRLDQQIAMVPL